MEDCFWYSCESTDPICYPVYLTTSQWVHKESISKQGRKFAKGKPSVHRDPLFDEIPEDTLDHIETENAQVVGRTRDIVGEEKGNDENILSTEDVLSTDKEKLSTNKEKVSTDRPIVSTDGSKVSTDRQNEGTEENLKVLKRKMKVLKNTLKVLKRTLKVLKSTLK
ncbi:hypothetical protein Tco_0338670, partial [Tanacetum coccineum]